MTSIRRSRHATPKNWVGKCTACKIWRSKEHTIIDQKTQKRYCLFDGAVIQQGCGYCNRTGKDNGTECIKCNGSGMEMIR